MAVCADAMESAHVPAKAETYDVVVVGSGITGSWAAKQLAEQGLAVMLLEAGPHWDAADLASGSGGGWACKDAAPESQRIQQRHFCYWTRDPRLFVDDVQNPYSSDTSFTWIRGRQVGGRSHLWGGMALRFSDFELAGLRHHGRDYTWPIRHADLAPHYHLAESFLGVRGARDGLSQLPDGSFVPPCDLTSEERRFQRDIEGRWPGRRVIHGRGIPGRDDAWREKSGGSWTQRCSLNKVLPAALVTGNVKLRPNTIVSHLLLSADGTLTRGVACIDRVSHQPLEVLGRAVILCASAYESVRVMLNSAGPRHPGGVGNSSGLLGRHIFDHIAVSLSGKIANTAEQACPSWEDGHGIIIPRCLPEEPGRAGFGVTGAIRRRAPGQSGDASWSLTALAEVLPLASNRVSLSPTLHDAWRIRSAHVDLAYGEQDLALAAQAQASLRAMADAAGLAVESCATTGPGEYVHELGGAPMGRDSRSSVLNPRNQCWDVPNLYVTDGAAFVTSGWQNPALTMMAITIRACGFVKSAIARGQR